MLKDLNELQEAKIISPEVAKAITDYYHQKQGNSSNRLMLIFGILGALLVGLGIILIVAHNWDEMPRGFKTILAFIPLALGQAALGYAILKKKDSKTWREASACILVLAVGACLSLISQIYHIEGDLGGFLFAWSILTLPIVYLASSNTASMLYILLISYYTVENGLWKYGEDAHFKGYWLLFIAIIPYVYTLFKRRLERNFILVHSFLIPISMSIGLGAVSQGFPHILSLAFMCLFSLLYGLGYVYKSPNQEPAFNGFILFGSMASVVLLFMSSSKEYWAEIKEIKWSMTLLSTNEFYFAVLFFLLALAVYAFYFKNKNFWEYIQPMMPVFVFYMLIFVLGQFLPELAQILVNMLIFTLGIWTLRQGASINHLGVLNYGLLLIATLVVCRFFDTNMSFVLRGFIFMALGLGFFLTNVWMIKKRKNHEL